MPADIRIIEAESLRVDQSLLDGMARSVGKSAQATRSVDALRVLDADTLVFLGSTVLGGRATGVVVGTGADTYFGALTTDRTVHPDVSYPLASRLLRAAGTIMAILMVLLAFPVLSPGPSTLATWVCSIGLALTAILLAWLFKSRTSHPHRWWSGGDTSATLVDLAHEPGGL